MVNKEILEKSRIKAQELFHEQRVQKLSVTFFPNEEIHPKFKKTLLKLIKFNSAKQMSINKETWKNMCTFHREFFMPEIEVCFQIFERTTPYELIAPYKTIESLNDEGSEGGETAFSILKSDEIVLKEYNEKSFPELMEIINKMKDVWINIDKQISIPIARKINSDLKISFQLPIGTDFNFVVLPNYR